MFRFSLILLSIIICILIGLDSNFFREKPKSLKRTPMVEVTDEKYREPNEVLVLPSSTVQKEQKKRIQKSTEIDPYIELKKIIHQAKISYMAKDFNQSIEYYNSVIRQSIKSQDIRILKLFAMAHFRKASIYKYTLNKEHETIMDEYDAIIKRFKNQKEIELLKLYAKAQFYKANISERDIALNLYDEVIRKFSQSSDVTLRKIYTQAQFNKSYLTTGSDSLDIFNEIIENLKNQTDKKLLLQRHKAQQNKAYLLEQYFNQKEEAIEVYDDIIKEFSFYTGDEYQEIVENALLQKSFLLMDYDDAEAMEIYDKIIKKYETATKNSDSLSPVPLKIEYSIINNIELSLITNNDDSSYRELAEKYLSNIKDTKPQLEMLEILKNAQISNQDEALSAWQEENREYSFKNWSFEGLEHWNEQMEEGAQKSRIKSYLNEFTKHNNSINSSTYTQSK
jgi:regulator of sigma D